MGQSRIRKEAFFRANPFCCFCGGSEPAVTVDHVPNRASFPGRAAPEGFEFPACKACNDDTRLDEIAFSIMVHLVNQDDKNVDSANFRKLLQGLQNNLPDLAKFAEMTNREKRTAMRDLNIIQPAGKALDEVFMLRIPEGYGEYIDRYLRKLVKAIHYRHVGSAAPSSSVTWAEWSYGQIGRNRETLATWQAMTPTIVNGTRTNIDFGDRFRYRVNHDAELEALAAVGQFGNGMIFYGVCVSPQLADGLDSLAFRRGTGPLYGG